MGLDTNLVFFRFAHKTKFSHSEYPLQADVSRSRPDRVCHIECFAEVRSKMYRDVRCASLTRSRYTLLRRALNLTPTTISFKPSK